MANSRLECKQVTKINTHIHHTHKKKQTVKLYMIRLSYCETSVKVLKQAK